MSLAADLPAPLFELEATCPQTGARAGRLHTPHGTILTPAFMPVGTVGSVRGIPQEFLETDLQANVLLANTYHLFLRPGTPVLEAAGGLHRFMSWERPILTDSGGYQVYSLAERRKLDPGGVTFRSHIDGSPQRFTPEGVVDIQRSIGPDIQMVLDECPPYPSDKTYARQSLQLTSDWARRARRQFLAQEPLHDYPQLQFGIVQGSTYPDLRRQSVEETAALDFEGNAIGGLSVGEPTEELYDLTQLCCELLPAQKPRYLMGVGTPANLLSCIARGVDFFDCVLPTRNARHSRLYYRDGIRTLTNLRYAADFSPLDAESALPQDRRYSKAYVRHLFHTGEQLANTIASLHNLHLYLRLMAEARAHILSGDFAAWQAGLVPALGQKHGPAEA